MSHGGAARAADKFGGISMKRILGGMVVAAALSGSAFAADLGPRTYAKAPAVAPVSNWSGLYVGGNLGYGWGSANTDVSFLPTPAEFGFNNTTLGARSSGVIGGAQLGYNWQIGSVVTGLEADIQGSGIKGSARAPAIPTFIPDGSLESSLSSEHKLSWFGTVRGRLGVTVTPELLIYGTGGLAYGRVDASANWFEFDFGGGEHFQAQAPASVSKTKVGWTAGAGAEWMFARNWSAKLEYLYVDLGSESAIGDETANVPINPAKVGYLAYPGKHRPRRRELSLQLIALATGWRRFGASTQSPASRRAFCCVPGMIESLEASVPRADIESRQ
jgi:outer membrane immunogenic protein